jgi:serine/threonine-protein kinase
MSDSVPGKPASELTGRVGRYEIRHLVGRGAMGVVYRAYDTVLERDVALKVMAAHMADDPAVLERFTREARAVARMTHPNVVTVYDLGSHDNGSPYIAMELLNGQDLAKALRTPPGLPLGDRLGVVLQVLAGLGHAHKAGIVHRDIKPANVFLSADGTVKLMDFGIARLTSASMTGTGAVMGTADYMSPEQVRGAKVDGRSDLFSVGCVLFELLTGQRPFHADELMAIFFRITSNEPDWALVTPAGLLPVLRKALSKDLGQRYATAEEFAAELRAAMARLSLGPAATMRAWPSPPTVVVDAKAPTFQEGRATVRPPLDPTRVMEPAPVPGPGPRASRRGLVYGGAAALVLAAGVTAAVLAARSRTPPVAPPSPVASTAASLAAAQPDATAPPPVAIEPPPPAAAVSSAPPASVRQPPSQAQPPRTPPPVVPTADPGAGAPAEASAQELLRAQVASRVAVVLSQAESDLSAQKYDAAIQGFERALAIDPQNSRALQGKTGAITARAIAQAALAQARVTPGRPAGPGRVLVASRTTARGAEGGAQDAPEGFTDTPGVTVKRGSQAAELPGRILFETEPAALAPGATFKVRIYLLNEGNAPIQVRDMVVGTSVNSRLARGPVPPLAREVAPRQKALLREVSGIWKEDTTAWNMEVLVRTARGEAYQNRLTWQ